jgi:NAD(P)-dependent dehydrogenase (short-subunit alcohol dehydrogenase family)
MATINLSDKVALVTGSARRVGRAIALELARQGMHQVVHYSTSEHEAEATADEIRALAVKAITIQADHSQPADVQRLFEMVHQQFGRLDLLVNSASIFKPAHVMEISLEEWQHVMDVNLTGPFLCSQHAARIMQDQESGGAIINILDITALRSRKRYPHHSVSKAGLWSLTEVLALSLAPKIRVNAIAAGPVLRDEGSTPEQWQQFGERLPVGHTGEPQDVAQAVVFLASQPFITGAILRVDGGDYLR